MTDEQSKWVAYLVRCSDKSLYCGISNDIKNRLIEHNSGKGAKYTRSRRPVELVGISSELTKSAALKLEYRIKQLPADRKITELKKKEKQMTVNQDLKALQNEFKALGKKVEKLTKAVKKAEKTQAKAAKAMTAKKAPVKKKTVAKKKAPAKKKSAAVKSKTTGAKKKTAKNKAK
jgi:putative endonuclease